MAVVKPLKYFIFLKSRLDIQVISLSWIISVSFTVFVRTLDYSLEKPLVINIIGWFFAVFELFLSFIVIFCFASMLGVV